MFETGGEILIRNETINLNGIDIVVYRGVLTIGRVSNLIFETYDRYKLIKNDSGVFTIKVREVEYSICFEKIDYTPNTFCAYGHLYREPEPKIVRILRDIITQESIFLGSDGLLYGTDLESQVPECKETILGKRIPKEAKCLIHS